MDSNDGAVNAAKKTLQLASEITCPGALLVSDLPPVWTKFVLIHTSTITDYFHS